MAAPILGIRPARYCPRFLLLPISYQQSRRGLFPFKKTKSSSIPCIDSPSQSEEQPLSELCLSVGSHLIPHPRKVDKGGEDAFFVGSYRGGVIAVADGVSGWAEENVDPSRFPRELMSNLSRLIEKDEVSYDPQTLMGRAHAVTSSVGSATVIAAILEKNGMLKIANVGDCGLKLIRGGKVMFSTVPQEHYFDCPYQLSSEINGQTCLDAKVYAIDVAEGDTIVMGSDGLFDNVFDHEIVSAIVQHKDVAEAAKVLADLASYHSGDASFDSPYSLEARNRGFDVPLWKKILGMQLIGGKLDDISVIVGRVVCSRRMHVEGYSS